MQVASQPGFEEGSRSSSRTLPTFEDLNPPVQQLARNSSEDEPKHDSATNARTMLEEFSDVDGNKYVHGMRLFLILASLLVTFFTVLLDTSIIATAIPKITDDFHKLGDVSWYGAAFMMTMGGTQSAWGKVYKYFPPKVGFLVAVFIFESASVVCGAAPNSTALIIGRALAGVGAAGIASGTFTVIALVVEPKHLATFTGITAITNGVSSAIGPLVGGALADKVTWRWCFYINIPIGALAVPFIVFFLRIPPQDSDPSETGLRQKMTQVDPVGVILVMGGIVSFIQALHFGGSSKPWSSSTVIGLLVGSTAIGVAFAAWEWRQGERAAIPPRLMADRNVMVNSLYTALLAGSYFTVIYYLPIYFQSIDDVSATMSGVRNLPLIISVSVTILLSSAFVSKTGPKPLLLAGAALATVGCSLLYTLGIGSAPGKWIGYQFVAGIGWGLSFQLPIITVQDKVAPRDIGPATAIILFFQTVGAAFFLAAAQCAFLNQVLIKLRTSAPDVNPASLVATGSAQLRSVFTAEEMPGILAAYVAGLNAAFALSAGTAGLAFVVAVFSSRKPLSVHTDTNSTTEEDNKIVRNDGQAAPPLGSGIGEKPHHAQKEG